MERGTGLLNNALYVGRLEWNRCSYKKNPQTGRRVACPNPREKWEVAEVPHLRIVDDALWNRVKARQEDVRIEMTRDADGNALNRAHRRQFLLSGLMRCGGCGGPYAIITPDRYGCATRRAKGTCDNRLMIDRAELERRVLGGLKERLMAPELVEAFRCDSGDDGAVWFFKRGMSPADWNIRVSMRSMALALYGLGGVRHRLYAFLGAIGAEVGAESIGRVDYAVDILSPGFELVPDQFVMHSHTDRQDRLVSEEMAIGGKAGRVTSVTVGHMPRRQVIVYDKRAEVIQTHKVHWWEIWNATRRRLGQPDLDRKDRIASRVWRVEVRAGKHHLYERWGIRRWSDLDEKIGDLFQAALKAIRYTEANGDTNRSRWPNHEIWNVVTRQISGDLFEMMSAAEPVRVKAVRRDHQCELLRKQILGGITAYSVIAGMTDADVEELPEAISIMIDRHLREEPDRFERSRDRAAERYDFIASPSTSRG